MGASLYPSAVASSLGIVTGLNCATTYRPTWAVFCLNFSKQDLRRFPTSARWMNIANAH